VTSITNERDGGSLDLLLVTDLTPKEFIFGKMLGVAYVTWEMLAAPLVLCLALYFAGALKVDKLLYLLIGLGVMDVFVITLGMHSGMNYPNSKTAIGVSLGSVFFLFLGVVTLILFMISFSSSYQVQLGPFLAFIVGGSVGLFVMLGYRNPSSAIGWASLLLPLATFLAITNFLVDHVTTAFFLTAASYGFTTVAMLIVMFWLNWDFGLIAVAVTPRECIQSSTTRANFAIFRIASSGTLEASAYPRIWSILCLTRASLSRILPAFPKTSERSMVLTEIPEASRSFSLYRVVLKAFGRAPTAPIRTRERPRTTRQTARNCSRSRRNRGLRIDTV